MPAYLRLRSSRWQALVSHGDDRTEVDLESDARPFPVDKGPGFQLLMTEELAVDKVRAVFGRTEARDFADLMPVEERFGLDRLLEIASEKDHGFDVLVFSDMTERFDRLRRDEFPLDDGQYGRLARIVRNWRAQAREIEGAPYRGRTLGNDRGIGR